MFGLIAHSRAKHDRTVANENRKQEKKSPIHNSNTLYRN